MSNFKMDHQIIFQKVQIKWLRLLTSVINESMNTAGRAFWNQCLVAVLLLEIHEYWVHCGVLTTCKLNLLYISKLELLLNYCLVSKLTM